MRTDSRGQTLIETIVAIFVLTSGLSAGLALAIYSFGSSSDISERISATGLAREGVEGIRRMRDSNWLWGKQNSQFASCPELGAGQNCYQNWLSSPYSITGSAGTGTAYRLKFDPNAAGNKFTLDSGSDYRLYVQAGGAINHNAAGTALNLFRKVYIIYQNTSTEGFTPSHPLVMVRSVVWWWGKNCPRNTDYNLPAVDTACKIISEENLTNWKNY